MRGSDCAYHNVRLATNTLAGLVRAQGGLHGRAWKSSSGHAAACLQGAFVERVCRARGRALFKGAFV